MARTKLKVAAVVDKRNNRPAHVWRFWDELVVRNARMVTRGRNGTTIERFVERRGSLRRMTSGIYLFDRDRLYLRNPKRLEAAERFHRQAKCC